jgi:hypothetical protein
MKIGWRSFAYVVAVLLLGSAIYLNCSKKSTKSYPCLTLTVTGSGDGDIGIEPGTDCYYEGSQVTLTADPDEGWQFDSWSGDFNSSDNPAVVTFSNSNMNITANFSEIQLTLTVSVSPPNSGTVDVNPDQTTYDYGEYVTITAIPNQGYQFDHWSGLPAGADTTENPTGGTIEEDLDVTAYFVEGPANSATVSGTITWAGHTLSNYTYAFADSAVGASLYLVAQTGVNPSTGSYTLTISNMTGSLELLFEAQDDVDNSGPWNPITTGDGWGYYDYNGNSQWDTGDLLYISPGDNLLGIDITLLTVTGATSKGLAPKGSIR